MKRVYSSANGSERTGTGPASPVEMDRMDFLKKTGRLAGLALAAGSLGWLAGCGSGTTGSEATSAAPAPDTGSTAKEPQQSPQPAAPAAPATGAISVTDCRFYDDGICRKTGEDCTECILR